jgi:hypothetical protein
VKFTHVGDEWGCSKRFSKSSMISLPVIVVPILCDRVPDRLSSIACLASSLPLVFFAATHHLSCHLYALLKSMAPPIFTISTARQKFFSLFETVAGTHCCERATPIRSIPDASKICSPLLHSNDECFGGLTFLIVGRGLPQCFA